MPRFLPLFVLIGLIVSPSIALASYHVYCEMEGEVSSTPIFSDFINFEFEVTDSRDIEFENGSRGEPDCHLMKGKSIRVFLDPEDAGDQTQIFRGAKLTIRRYQVFAVLIDSREYTLLHEEVRVIR